MIAHVVLLQPKPDTSEAEMQAVLSHVCELQQKIAGIVEVHAGKNGNASNHKGYTYGFIMHFVDHVSLQAYAPHPDHQVVSAELVRLCSAILDFDLSF